MTQPYQNLPQCVNIKNRPLYDIERLVAQRQAEFNAAYAASKAPDNLATDTPPPVAPVTSANPVTPPPDAPPSPQAPKAPDNLASE